MPWLTRGLAQGIVTSRYPAREDGYSEQFHAAIELSPQKTAAHEVEGAAQACPTGAIGITGGRGQVDRGRCVLCGRCVDLVPAGFRFVPNFEVSGRSRQQLVVPSVAEDEVELAGLRAALDRRTKALRRSVHIRHVDAGSDGSEEWEVAALTNPIYDVQRLGIYFTASPRHADVLLVTGAGSLGMVGPLRQTYEAMANPKVVIAAGVDAISGGLVGKGYATMGGICSVLPVDVLVPGNPPSPFSLLHGVLLAVGILGAQGSSRRAVPRAVQAGPGAEVMRASAENGAEP